MPISNDDFNKGVKNTRLIKFFQENPNNAYSLEELRKQFSNDVERELELLMITKAIDMKYITNPKGKGRYYYRLKH